MEVTTDRSQQEIQRFRVVDGEKHQIPNLGWYSDPGADQEAILSFIFLLSSPCM
jgi:hypothetical protein